MASDNGVSHTFVPNSDPPVLVPVGSSGPLRGHKGSPYEAGARVANFIVWPDQISPSQTISSNVWIGDLTATFLDVAEAVVPENLDGRTMMGAITNNSPIVRRFGARRIMPLAWKFLAKPDEDRPEIVKTGQATIVSGWRKYIRNIHWDANGNRLPYVDEEFYDLRIDLGETTNRVDVPNYQYLVERGRLEFDLFGGDQMLEDLPDIPSSGVWAGFERTLDFGFPDGTDVLETTIP